MKHLRYLSCLILCTFFTSALSLLAQIASTSASQNIPFSFGLVGSIAPQFVTGRLAALQDIPRFPTTLNAHTGTILGGGIEVVYRLNPSWEIGLRGEYGQSSATTTGDENVLLSIWNPQLSRYQPTPAVVRNTLTSTITLLSLTPLARLFLGDMFYVGIGARFDVPLQASLRYRFDLEAPATFVSGTFPQRIDTALRLLPTARAAFSFSPILSVGASLAVGRVRFMPELQVQPFFQPLRGITPENTPWNQAALRFNLGIVFSFPAAQIPSVLSPSVPVNSTTSIASQSTPTQPQSVPRSSSSQDASTPNTQGTKAENLTAQEPPITFPVRLDTVFQRDTTIQPVAWNLADTVHMDRNTTQSRTVVSGKQITISESYTHDVPKPKPFLVANLDVRFIPALGAVRSAETKQAARLTEKPMIVRSLTASAAQGVFSPNETYDTVHAVRLPLVRFLPTISSEVGVRERLITIGSEQSSEEPLLTIIAPDAKPLDWDAQTLLFLPFSSNRTHVVRDTLAVWMTVADNEGQRIKTDAARITVENFDTAPLHQTTAPSSRQSGRWTLASLRVVSDSTSGALTLASEATMLREYLVREMAFRKSGSKTGFKNCTVYGVAPFYGVASSDTKMRGQLLDVARGVANALKTSSVYVVLGDKDLYRGDNLQTLPPQHFDKKTYAFPHTDAYIRVLVEE